MKPKEPLSDSGWVEVPAVAETTLNAMQVNELMQGPTRAWEKGSLRVISTWVSATQEWWVSVSRYLRCPHDDAVNEAREAFGMIDAEEVLRTKRQRMLRLKQEGKKLDV